MAKKNHEMAAMVTMIRIPLALEFGPNSETTLIPMNLDSI